MINYIKKLWHQCFLEERSSLGISLFRVAVAFTTGAHVIPSFFHMQDNYFVTAYKRLNPNFFTVDVLELVMKSPEWLIYSLAVLFCVSCLFFLIGFFSQFSCIVMTLSCYYFYALNAFHVGTLSWDILFVTLFLMCLTPYHGDYFSMDCLKKGREAFRKKRPYFLQRLLQLQIGFIFFYTALYKTTAEGNWITENPIFSIMNYPLAGTTKWFLFRDFLKVQPELCYAIGIAIVVVEYLMIFLLFYRKTRITAIYLGCFFHILLMLTLDVPATFFFLFPPQLFLFINPDHVLSWIENKRAFNQSAQRAKLIYDGRCQICRRSVIRLEAMDLFATLEMVDLHDINDYAEVHPELTKEKTLKQICLVDVNGELYWGFSVFRRICFTMPMLYPLIPFFYFPGMGILGPVVYR
ncbi:MAG: HTTM domain-containing protein, partial [Candidatus Omnitrophica bacterium]|nr:HTTM domain-containing protein [Candidatus Omnitrophota bacterium]